MNKRRKDSKPEERTCRKVRGEEREKDRERERGRRNEWMGGRRLE